jgi:hypothetical protein
MKRNVLFLMVAALWLTRASGRIQAEASPTGECSPYGAQIYNSGGWYCSTSPGDSQHICTYDMGGWCEYACGQCGGTFVSMGDCHWVRSEGSASNGDPTALSVGCLGAQWAQDYASYCNCSFTW